MPRLEATQANRTFAVTTPLGDDVLLFHSMSANEQLGRLFQIDLDLLSEDPEIKLQDILGQSVTVHFKRPDDETRYFNGLVSQFSQAGSHGNLFVYRATLHPWFWFLTRTADCRIFQNQQVPDIIKEVFRDQGFSDFEDALSGTYREWENCVQYRETDFNFISRLMEQEGIYYYFKHEDGKHTLVLSDSISAHETVTGYEEVPYYPQQEGERRERDHIYDWSLNQNLQPGIYALNDFDFKKPKANLEVKSSIPREHEQAEFEIYDYPGEYKENSDGETYVRARIEELQAQHEEVQGQGNVAGLMTGCLFKLTNYSREDQNREYLITAANYNLGPQEYESDFAESGGAMLTCGITAIDKQQAYRAPRITPKPIVQGPQTAIVVGKAGEEIWTDQYGRVKVQFHWDRYGKADEDSSCWVRVSQIWAGKSWGSMHIPRIGQEVIVVFLEGDPDQPIIAGRVYNEDNKPPYPLPDEKTKSTIKSNTSKGGGSANELLMEDLEGKTQVVLSNAYGHKITEDEDTQSLTIETRDQHKIHLDDKNKKISVQTTNAHSMVMDDTDTEGEGTITLSTTNGNSVTMDDKTKQIMTQTTDGHVLLMDDENKKIEITSTNGNTIILDDENEAIGITSTNGHYLTIDDAGESITLEDSGGEHKYQIDIGGGKLVLSTSGDIELGAGGKISLTAPDIEVAADNEVIVSGGSSGTFDGGIESSIKGVTTKVEGSAMTEVKGGLVKIN